MSPSDQPANHGQAPSRTRASESLAQQLRSHYHAQDKGEPAESPTFSQQWKTAQAYSERPPLLSPLLGHSRALWLTGLSLMVFALYFTLLPTLQESAQQKVPSAQGLEVSQLDQAGAEPAQDAFAWGDRWLEGEEWSLEWPSPEEAPPAPAPSALKGDREG